MLNKRLINTGAEAAAAFDPLQNFETVTYTGNGSTQKITGYIRKGAAFNGSSSAITASGLPSLTTFSLSFWLKAADPNADTWVIQFDDGVNNNSNSLFLHNFGTQFGFASAGNTTSFGLSTSDTDALFDNNWHNVVLTINGSDNANTKIYVDGSEKTLTRDAGSGTATIEMTSTMHIGKRRDNSATRYLNGSIDQVRIFDKAISSSEVTTLYNETYDSSTKSTTDIFNDGSGVALYELDEDANDTGTTPYGTGAIDSGQSAVFNGSSSRVNLSSNPINGLTSVSFSFWLKPADISSYQYVLSFINSVDGWNGVGVRVSNTGKINIVRANNGTVTSSENSTTTLQLNVWHHIAVTVSQSSTVIYLDGSEDGTFSSTPFTTNNTGSFDIGMNEYSPGVTQAFTEGSIDQVRIYSSVLSASDVEALASETNVPTANLVAHYKLDGNANDETGSYNGTPTNITYSDPAEFPLVQYNGTPTNVNFLGMAFQPDLVWIKNRDQTHNHILFDSVRGDGNSNGYYDRIMSNTTDAEQDTITDAISSLDSNGFTVVSAGSGSQVNNTNDDYVAWCWKAGGAAVSNTDGSITSQVSANPDAGFSIVKFTSSATISDTVGHGLSSAPEMIIYKRTNTTSNWTVYTNVIDGSWDYLRLNLTDAKGDSADTWATSSTIKNISTSGDWISYCFHSTDYQKVGSYEGNGTSKDIVTGFQPRFLLMKNADNSTGNWVIFDSVRGVNQRLFPDLSNAENTITTQLTSFNSDGFSVGSNVNVNGLNNTIIYLAIA